MEIRVLEYFMAVAREQSISRAANSLHLTQPTLSRQLKDLEDELGKQLFIRGNRKITLTEDGILLRKRADEILSLIRKTQTELVATDENISGDIYIGTGETDAIRLIARAACKINKQYPDIRFHISSGDSSDVFEHLDKGLIDFGIFLGQFDASEYEHLTFPTTDTWGVLMRKDCTLASKKTVCPSDLYDIPLIISRQTANFDYPFISDTKASSPIALSNQTSRRYELSNWIKKNSSSLNIVATYNLIYNASLMVAEELGVAICIDKLINTTGTNLCFRPFEPELKMSLNIIWKKYQIFSRASEKFIDAVAEEFKSSDNQ